MCIFAAACDRVQGESAICPGEVTGHNQLTVRMWRLKVGAAQRSGGGDSERVLGNRRRRLDGDGNEDGEAARDGRTPGKLGTKEESVLCVGPATVLVPFF